jgi:hypothetical protein
MFVTATELTQWADRLDSQSYLPQLIGRLIRASKPLDHVMRTEFRSGEGIALPGFDGISEVSGTHEVVPEGLAVWEMGTNKNPKRKADDDYQKRTLDPGAIDPQEAAFVFVTPRRWSRKQSWQAEKRSEGKWRDVRVIDADDLEAWLEQAPSVHVWLTTIVGRDLTFAEDLESFWNRWSDATDPPLSPSLVIGGRDDGANRLVELLSSETYIAALQSASTDEAIAFLAAAILMMPEAQRESLLARSVIIRDRATWLNLCMTQSSLLLIPAFDDPDIARALRNQHRIFVAATTAGAGSANAVELPPIRRSAATTALKEMGIPDEQTRELSILARRSLQSLRRRLALAPTLKNPEWAQPAHGQSVVPALFAGAWDDSVHGDRIILSSLSHREYADVETALMRWKTQPDPPVVRVGTTWYLVSKEDAWSLLRSLVTTEALARFRNACREVLVAPDPAIELAPQERWAAGLHDRTPAYSSLLAHGLADTIAAIGTRSTSDLMPDGQTGSTFATSLVLELLRHAAEDPSGGKWSTLVNALPLLAEAAPEAFLTTLDVALSDGDSALIRLLRESDEEDSLFGRHVYAPLTWALECLAWSADYLSRAALLLAAIARALPNSRAAASARVSLRSIFLLWYPQTSATVDDRIAALDALEEGDRTEHWNLLVSLVPQHGDHTLPTHAPTWRDWKPSGEVVVPLAEWHRAASEIGNRVLWAVGTDASRWKDILSKVSSLLPETQDALIDQLRALRAASMDEVQVAEVRSALREVIARHRRHPDAQWALSGARIDRLAEAYDRLAPPSPVHASAWLFEDNPVLPDHDSRDWSSYQPELNRLRDAAVRLIYAKSGTQGILDLAQKTTRPFHVGIAAGRQDLDDPQCEDDMLQLLGSPGEVERLLARGFVSGSFERLGWEWIDDVMSRTGVAETPQQQADVFLCLPPEQRTWDSVSRAGDDVGSRYWSQFNSPWFPDAVSHLHATQQLINHGRGRAAVDLLALYLHRDAGSLDPDLVIDALEAAVLDTSPSVGWGATGFNYDARQLLDYLRQRDDVDQSRIARLEWMYLPLLRFEPEPARLLHAELARDPGLFVELVTGLYRGDDEEPRELTDDELSWARRIHDLLHTWQIVPGVESDGTINAERLATWVVTARQGLRDRGRLSVGDIHIGSVLRYSPTGADGHWPSKAVRDVIEHTKSGDLERGIEVEIRNSRGVTTRNPFAGGDQERQLAAQYQTWAAVVTKRWPRTGAMLRRVADSFEREAVREDLRAQQLEEEL